MVGSVGRTPSRGPYPTVPVLGYSLGALFWALLGGSGAEVLALEYVSGARYHVKIRIH